MYFLDRRFWNLPIYFFFLPGRDWKFPLIFRTPDDSRDEIARLDGDFNGENIAAIARDDPRITRDPIWLQGDVMAVITATALIALRAPPAAETSGQVPCKSCNQIDRVRITISINSKYVRYARANQSLEENNLLRCFLVGRYITVWVTVCVINSWVTLDKYSYWQIHWPLTCRSLCSLIYRRDSHKYFDIFPCRYFLHRSRISSINLLPFL